MSCSHDGHGLTYSRHDAALGRRSAHIKVGTLHRCLMSTKLVFGACIRAKTSCCPSMPLHC
jgi:hypothetical protein